MEIINKKLGRGIGEFIRKAKYFTENDNYKEALKVCNKILNAHSECEEALLIKSECLFHLKRPDLSLNCLKTLLEINPNSDHAHFQVAMIMLAAHELKTALNAINTALRINNESFDNVILKAQILSRLNDSSYKNWIEKAGKIDQNRTDNFIKNYWIGKHE